MNQLHRVLVILSAFAATPALAESKSNDFGRSDSKREVLNAADLRSRFEVLGEIFLVDAEGKLLLQAQESRLWKFGSTGDILSNWSFSTPFIKEVAMRQKWSVSETGKISVQIEQFESMKRKDRSRDVVPGKLIKEEQRELKDFSPTTWIAHQDGKERVVVRLTPRLGDRTEYVQIDGFPLVLENPVLYDSKNRFWAVGRTHESRFISIKTHLGQVAMSYSPFKGASEIGYVEGTQITLNVDPEFKVFVRSERTVIPGSRRAKIYGFVDLKNQSESPNSVHTSASNKEKEFLEHLRD